MVTSEQREKNEDDKKKNVSQSWKTTNRRLSLSNQTLWSIPSTAISANQERQRTCAYGYKSPGPATMQQTTTTTTTSSIPFQRHSPVVKSSQTCFMGDAVSRDRFDGLGENREEGKGLHGHSNPPDFSYQTLHCCCPRLFRLRPLNMEWPNTPFHSERNRLWTHSNPIQAQGISFSRQ